MLTIPCPTSPEGDSQANPTSNGHAEILPPARPRKVRPALMSPKEVCRLFSITNRTVYRWVREDIFPQPIGVTRAFVRWRRKDVVGFYRDCARRAIGRE
jgi:predicted DNA-binding transcriptional regulator AlpA